MNEFDLAEGKRWILVNYVPNFDEDGKVRATVLSSCDITDLNLVEGLDSLMAAESSPERDTGDTPQRPAEFFEKAAYEKTLLSDMKKLRIPDLFAVDLGRHGRVGHGAPDTELGKPVCRVFDFCEISLTDSPASRTVGKRPDL